ncbi:cation diffusion facilitator family transporter [Marinobacterium sediminicola]|uniref:Cation diffusion facilitator family transporter n=1 Tax=Marinobacterium sediminicola TaxID=518898 RepID=A0ABY1RVR4_9GAMM|nr:cation diffusion facilitator family transporter [Marinobacterium sediminicola]ULG70572.1 cation diffusion facilitator family transporter [Marinobacterium sediminicola]SMR68987.1 cation diffusion facilitator family transporter [Marinobacterium sediminicola]
MQEQLDQRRRAAERVTIIGAVLDTVLGVLKILIGVIANSSALIADGIHSLSDLLTDFMVVAVLRLSHRAPDDSHPWGHGRFETVGTVALGVVLVGVGGAMAYDSVSLLFAVEHPPLPTWPALLAAALSIVGKEWIFRYTLKIGKKLQSDLIIANAWHSRTDALSSIVVLLAVAGAMAGVWWLDALAAVLVALLVGKIGWDLVAKSVTELVDTALPEDRVEELREQVLSVDGVINVHSFKSRLMGNQSLLEMHLQVAPHLSAAEGHYIGDNVVCKLQNRFDNIGHVIFHIDTYDDEIHGDVFCPVMPSRREVSQHLDATMSRILGENPDYELILYYHPEFIDLDIKASPQFHQLLSHTGLSARELEEQLREQLSSLNWFRKLSLWLPPQ